MCGIAGICRTDSQPVDQSILTEMSYRLRHRGPDDVGVYTAGAIGLAFRRLAILDLTTAGHEPMSNEDGTCWLVFNGEVYNYRDLARELQSLGHSFRSRSDSESVLHAYEQWGPACVSRLNGMFAFAIWDERKQILFAARDRFGIKPFYYHLDSRRLCFASEIKALFADPDVPNRADEGRLYDYLVYSHLDHTANTMFAGIYQLPPAHTLTYRDGSIRIDRYWELDPAVDLTQLDDAQATERFRELFFDSVRLHLQSDVPVGTCLSGGLDSSAIVCTVNRLLADESVNHEMLGESQHTFTSCFDDPRFDERSYVEQVVHQTGARPFYTFPNPDELPAILPRVLWHQDEPFISTSIISQWYVMQLARQQGITVLLDGQGGDEVLAGYHIYFAGQWGSLLRHGKLAALLRELSGYRARHGAPARHLLSGALGLALPGSVRGWRDDLRQPAQPRWLGPDLASAGMPWRDPAAPYGEPFARQLYQFLSSINLPALLHYEDRNSMAFSVEARVPFLDHRLVEFVFALPARLKLRDGETKWVLRRALADVLPPAIANRQDKMGFVTPEAIWLRTSLRKPMESIFRSDSFRHRPYWRDDEVLRLFQAHVNGKADHHAQLWRILNAEIWLQHFVDCRPVEPARQRWGPS